MENTTTIGSGLLEAEKIASPTMEAPLPNSLKRSPNGGKNIGKTVKKQLPRESEFAILLSQISSCRQSGIIMRWMQLPPNNVVALIIPDAHLCENKHLYIGDKCNYCLSQLAV